MIVIREREREKQIKDLINSQLHQLHKIGLKPVSIKLQSSSQAEISINLDKENINPRIAAELEDRREYAPDMLYLLLRYGISQESYHEIAMRCPQLPRLYQVCSHINIELQHYVHVCK